MSVILQQEKMSTQERIHRTFSQELKRKIVGEIERNLVTVTQVSKQYQVTRAAIYKWINRFGTQRDKLVKQVVELKSDTRKLLAQTEQIKELHVLLGEKVVQLDFLAKQLEIYQKRYGKEVKKKLPGKVHTGGGTIPIKDNGK